MDERTVFLEAIEQPTPERREAFLVQACGADQELRRKVDDLLRAHVDAGSFIEHSPAGANTSNVRGSDEDTDDRTAQFHSANPEPTVPPDINLSFLTPSSVPQHLGKLGPYEILEVMGRGAFGIVLRALDPKLNRVVAIKVLVPELAANAMSVRRFLKEAQAAAAVSHDHIVTIHAVDDATALPFIVMECILGQSLQQKIDRQGALPVPEILRIGIQIASGLAAAHKNGLVHRDIKPANILLENGVQRVKITDFGLARAVDDLAHTQTFQVAGTPQYMSPEQAHGEVIDQRSDLFSLGSVLYTMCIGRPAFRAESIMGILKRVCDDTPRPIREVNSDIPDWLCAIIARLMEKKPQDRFRSADDVVELLRSHLAGVQQETSDPRAKSRPMIPEPSRRGGYLRPFSPYKLLAVMVSLVLAVMMCFALLIVVAVAIPVIFYSRSEWQVQDRDAAPPIDTSNTILEQPGVGIRSGSEVEHVAAWAHESTSLWIDLLQSNELKDLSAAVKGASWQGGVLVLSSSARKSYCQVWVDNLQLRNARMKLKVVVQQLTAFGTVEVGWDHQSGSPRRMDAVLINRNDGNRLFEIWQYDELFNVNRMQARLINPDWTKPITMTCEIRNGKIAAQYSEEVLRVANGLDPNRSVVPLIGVENATIKVLEWRVQDLDAVPKGPATETKNASRRPEKTDEEPLFNGVDLTGWKAPKERNSWNVIDGVLFGHGDADSFLITERGDWKDFHLTMEAKINVGGEAGFYFRAPFNSEGVLTDPCYEVRLTGIEGQAYPTGSLLHLVPVAAATEDFAPTDDWFTMEMIVRNSRVAVYFNKRLVQDQPLDLEPMRKGHLAIQIRSNATTAQFRKIEIKDLSAEK